jgi:hypothetical protein
MKAILEVVAGGVLKWGESVHVLLAIDKKIDTKVNGGHRLSQERTIDPANIEVS